MKPRSYVAGQGLAVVRPGLVVLVDDGGTVTPQALWEFATGEPDVLALIDVLGAGNFTTLPSFAGIMWDATHVRILVRGTHSVQLVDSRGERTARLDGAGVSTWSEHHKSLDAVAAILVNSGRDPVDSVELSIESGIVRAERILVGDLSTSVTSTSEPAPLTTEVSPSAAGSRLESQPDAPEVQRDSAPPTPAQVADASATLIETDEARYDAQWGATIAGRRPEDAVRDVPQGGPVGARPLAPPPPSAAGAGYHDDHTITPEQFAHLRASRGSTRTTEDSHWAAQGPAPVAQLKLSTGKLVLVSGPVIVGRSPQTRNASLGELPFPVVVEDPEQLVSGTHVEFTVTGGQLIATDVSRNGTELELPGAPRQPMTTNMPTVIPDGTVLHLSEDISIEVVML